MALVLLVCYHNSIRVRSYLLRAALVPPSLSPWHKLHDEGDSSSILHITGLMREAFDSLLYVVIPFAMLDMTAAFRGEIVAPFETCFVVVIKRCSLLSIGDRVTGGREVKNHVANIDSETRSHVCSANLGVAGAERGTFLTISLPSDGAAGAENDGAAHAAEFEEREL
jgi:hypothetical protein